MLGVARAAAIERPRYLGDRRAFISRNAGGGGLYPCGGAFTATCAWTGLATGVRALDQPLFECAISQM